MRSSAMLFGHLLLCRTSAADCVRITTVVVGILLIWPWTGVSSARDQAVGLTAADQLLEQACQAKATGNQGAAFALLHRIVRIAPDNLLARWQLGQVKVDNDWLSIEESQRR